MVLTQTTKARLLAGMSAIAMIATAGSAIAGGYAVREQSTEFQGMSFAGNATSGGGISSIFWNPATAAYAPAGLTIEAHGALVLPNSSMSGIVSFGGVNLGLPGESGEVGKEAIVPSAYMTYRLSRDLVFGFNVNAPFGFRNGPENQFWAGQTFSRDNQIKTMNYQASLGYQLAPWLAVGAGIQLQTMRATLGSATGTASNSLTSIVAGSDTSLGWSAGINITPMKGTAFGVGYRSAIQNTLEGGISVMSSPFPFLNPGAAVVANTTTPDTVTASLRQAIAPNLTLLGTVEWTNWSSLKSLDIVCSGGPNVAFCPAGNGQLVRSLALGWHDSWFYSVGLEYQAMPSLTLRAGGAYEKSPIQNATERTLRVTDADRIWASVGATYKISNAISFDLAYSHIWVDDAPIDRTESGLRFVGNANTSLDIVSASFKWKLGEAK